MDEPGGISITMDITAPTVVKASPGRVAIVAFYPTSGQVAYGSIHNCSSTGAVAEANKIFDSASNAAKTSVSLQMPCDQGIVAVPGSNTRMIVTYT